jgi:hypothetical protein
LAILAYVRPPIPFLFPQLTCLWDVSHGLINEISGCRPKAYAEIKPGFVTKNNAKTHANISTETYSNCLSTTVAEEYSEIGTETYSNRLSKTNAKINPKTHSIFLPESYANPLPKAHAKTYSKISSKVHTKAHTKTHAKALQKAMQRPISSTTKP